MRVILTLIHDDLKSDLIGKIDSFCKIASLNLGEVLV